MTARKLQIMHYSTRCKIKAQKGNRYQRKNQNPAEQQPNKNSKEHIHHAATNLQEDPRPCLKTIDHWQSSIEVTIDAMSYLEMANATKLCLTHGT